MTSSFPLRLDLLLREASARVGADDARALLAHALGRSPAWLFAHDDARIEAPAAARCLALVARREAGEPVAYLTGRRGFWTLDLAVGPDTLIPRPETELLVELALERMPADRPLRVLDLGTGSGAIALALASERPRARIVGSDRSAGALAVARGNAQALGLGNVDFVQGDWYAAPVPDGRFDLVVSNPPYIAAGDPHLAQGDLRHEPAIALSPGGDGLGAIRTIVAGAGARLADGGWLLLEHGLDQGEPVRALLHAAGLSGVQTRRDLEARDRVTLGRRAHARDTV